MSDACTACLRRALVVTARDRASASAPHRSRRSAAAATDVSARRRHAADAERAAGPRVRDRTWSSPPPLGRVFAAEQGLIFNAIRPDKVTDFETVIAKLRAALANSKDPVRNQQGWGWKIFKAAEPGPNGSVLYVFVMDPAVKGADYGVAKILAEAYPTEIMELYRMYSGAFATAGQTLINLQRPLPTRRRVRQRRPPAPDVPDTCP